MEIKKDLNQFYVEENGEKVGTIDFIPSPKGAISVTHTFVNPRLRGQGIAAQLVDHLVQYARTQGLKVVPICPYVVKVMKENPNYRNVL